MEIASIQGEKRQPGGRQANARLRRRGFLPAVIYGHGREPETVALSLHDTAAALERVTHVVKVTVEGAEDQYLIKDVQYDHLQSTPVHVDLMRVDATERVHVKVPIVLRGVPKGTQEGGTLVHVISDLDVECLLFDIPEALRVRVDHLVLNGTLHVRDIPLPDSVRVLHDPEDIVAVVHSPRGTTAAELEAAAEGAEANEPEVIGRGSKETDDEGGASK